MSDSLRDLITETFESDTLGPDRPGLPVNKPLSGGAYKESPFYADAVGSGPSVGTVLINFGFGLNLSSDPINDISLIESSAQIDVQLGKKKKIITSRMWKDRLLQYPVSAGSFFSAKTGR